MNSRERIRGTRIFRVRLALCFTTVLMLSGILIVGCGAGQDQSAAPPSASTSTPTSTPIPTSTPLAALPTVSVPEQASTPSTNTSDGPASNPLTAIIDGGDANLKDCVRQVLGDERYTELVSQPPAAKDMELAGPCLVGEEPPRQKQDDAEKSTTDARPASNPLVAIIDGNDANRQDCARSALGEDRYQELLSRAPTEEEMQIAGPCLAGERQGGPREQRGPGRSGGETGPASNPIVAIIEGNDDSLKLCIQQSLGADVYEQLRSRPPSQAEMEIAGPCLTGNRTALECPATNDVTSTAWVLENTLFDRHYWGIETPREGRQGAYEGTGSADPRVIQLPDGRYRMYFAGGDLQEVTYVSTATSTDGVNFSLDDARILDIPKGTNGGGAHTSFVPLDDGSWRVYASTRGIEDRHILSYKAEDGLQLVQEPGRRLTLNEVGGGDLMSPYVIRDPGGGYRMFLTKAPDGEKIGQVGGNSTTWIVSAISDDGLNWSMTDQVINEAQRPSVLVNDDGTIELWFTFGMNAGLLRMKDVMHDGDLSMSEIEFMNIKAGDVDVHRIAGGGYRVYGGFGNVNEGGSIRVLRSVTVPWRVELVYLGMNRDPEGEILGVCISGTSDEPIKLEAHLSLKERIPIDTRIVNPVDFAPFSTTLIHVGDEALYRDVWLTVTSGDYIQEFRLTNYVPTVD